MYKNILFCVIPEQKEKKNKKIQLYHTWLTKTTHLWRQIATKPTSARINEVLQVTVCMQTTRKNNQVSHVSKAIIIIGLGTLEVVIYLLMKPYPFLTLNHLTVPKTFVAAMKNRATQLSSVNITSLSCKGNFRIAVMKFWKYDNRLGTVKASHIIRYVQEKTSHNVDVKNNFQLSCLL